MKEDKAALDCCKQLYVGMVTWSGTGQATGPPLKPPLPSQMCNSFLRSHCWRPGRRNYTRDDPVLLGLSAIQVGLTFVTGYGLILLPVLPPEI